MELSYDEIRRIHRLEKNSAKLVHVEQEFFNFLDEFITGEKKEYLESLKDFSSTKSRDFSNLKKMIEEIFALREKKIMNLALVASRTNVSDETSMAMQEKKLFNEILRALKKHNGLLGDIFSDNGSTPQKDKDLNNLSVEILSDIPSFVGVDMKEYGPFKKGSVEKLPVKIANLLVERKLAEVKS
tara:strand:- start:1670 stop:2224 length:555 start_codon:yes stop_codon:yes gene_type:complete